MKYNFSILFIFLFTFKTFANDRYKKLIQNIEKDIVSYDTKIALRKVDSVLVKDFKVLSGKEKITFQILKIQALTKANLFDASLQLSNKILKSEVLNSHQKIKVLISNALTYEYIGKFIECKQVLNELTHIFEVKSVEKNNLYAEYLYRTSSFYRVQNIKDKALEYALKSKEFSEQNNYVNESAVSSMLLGFLNVKSNTKIAEQHFKTALKFWKNVKDEHGISGMYLSLAKIEIGKKNYKKALKYCDSTIVIEKETKRFSSLAYTYNIKSNIFEKIKQLDSVIVNLKKYQKNLEKRNLDEQEIKINQLDYNFKIEKEKLKREQILHDLEDQKKWNNQLNFTIFSLLILVLIILFLYLKIFLKNKKIKQQQITLNQINKELTSSIKEKNILLKELHHRVKNNLSMILSLINLQSDKLENKDDKKLLDDLEQRINTIAITHNEFLYNETNNKHNLQNYVNKVINNLVALSINDIEITKNIEKSIISLDTALPIGFIINELITNSLKHSKPKEKLEIIINIFEKENKIIIDYFDNGLPQKSTKNNEHLGLFLIESMVAQLNGIYQENNFKYYFILNKK